MIVHPSAKSPFMIQRHPREQVQRNVSFVDTCTYCNINKCTYRQMYMHGVLYLGKCICTSKCRIHFTECPDLKPLTGRSRSMRRKAGDSSPEHQESIYDTEASKRAGSKKREFCGYCNINKCTFFIHPWCSLFGKSAYVLVNVAYTLQSVRT